MINPSKLDQFNPEQEEKYEAVGEERYTAEPQGPNSAQRSNSRTLSTRLVIAMCSNLIGLYRAGKENTPNCISRIFK